MDLAIETTAKEDGSKVLRSKVENEPSIKKMLKQFGASLQITSIDNSRLNSSDPTESFGTDSNQNMIITQFAHKVTITGQVSLTTMETTDDRTTRENAANGN